MNTEEVIAWMREGKSRTVGEIIRAFPGRGHAIVVMILMLLPATPLPTGIFTHIFEVISSMLLLQSLVGARELWLPKRLKQVKVRGEILEGMSKTLSKLAGIDKHLRINGPKFSSRFFCRIINLLTLIFVVGAFLAPPFSGLDTLPSIGAVLLSLSLMLESTSFALVGLVAGGIGLGIEISLSRFIFRKLMNLFGT